MKRQRSTKQTDSLPRWYRGANVPKSVICRFADTVAKRFQPDKIILFGSHAYGTPHADSDVDILVVMPAQMNWAKPCRFGCRWTTIFPWTCWCEHPRTSLGDWRTATVS